MVSLVSPFPREHYSLLWEWINEFPLCSIDDQGPQNYSEFADSMDKRIADGQHTFEVQVNGFPVGAIAYRMISEEIALFRGICFAKAVHRSGIARDAVSRVIADLFAGGAERVYAEYFADSMAVDRFLAKLGAVEIENSWKTTKRQGVSIPVKVVVIEPVRFQQDQRPGIDSQHRRASPGIPVSS